MPTWPTTGSFPQKPLAGTLSEESTDIDIDDGSDTGPWRTRQKYSVSKRIWRFAINLTPTQKATLQTFLGTVGRATPFDWPHPDLGTISVRFAARPVYHAFGSTHYRAQIEIREA